MLFTDLIPKKNARTIITTSRIGIDITTKIALLNDLFNKTHATLDDVMTRHVLPPIFPEGSPSDYIDIPELIICHGTMDLVRFFCERTFPDDNLTLLSHPKLARFLFLAASFNKFEIVSYLISQRDFVDEKDQDGNNALHYAYNSTESLQLLLQHGVKHQANKVGWFPLHLTSNIDCLKILLQQGISVNLATQGGSEVTPLHWLVKNSKAIELVKFLIQAGATVHKANKNGEYVLPHAFFSQDLSMIQLLWHELIEVQGFDKVKMSNLVTHKQKSLLHFAVKSPKILAWVLSQGAIQKEDSEGFLPIHDAAFHGILKTLQPLIVNLQETRSMSFQEAINIESTNGVTPLYLAKQQGRTEVIKWLQENGAEERTIRDNPPTVVNPPSVPAFNLVETITSIMRNTTLLEQEKITQLEAIFIEHAVTLNQISAYEDKTPETCGILSVAVEQGHLNLCRFLLERNWVVEKTAEPPLPLIEKKNANQTNILFTALRSGNAEIFYYLLSHSNSKILLEKNKYHNNVFHFVAMGGNTVLIKFLFGSMDKAEINERLNTANTLGIYPIHFAVKNGHLPMTEILFKSITPEIIHAKTTENNSETNLFELVIEKGYSHLVKRFLDCGVENKANQNGWFPIHVAVQKGDLVTVEYLCSHFQNTINLPNENEWGFTPLHVAAKNGHVHIVKWLLEHGVVNNACKKGWFSIHFAAEKGDLPTIEYLCSYLQSTQNISFRTTVNIPQENEFGSEALHLAASNGHAHLVKWLLEQGAEYKATKMGAFPLFQAAQKGDLQTIEYLCAYLQSTQNISLQTAINTPQESEYGDTTLHAAAENGHAHLVTWLLERGVEYKATKKGWFPIHLAAKNGHIATIECMCLYLQSSQNIPPEKLLNSEVADEVGQSTLDIAARGGHTDLVKWLLLQGALHKPFKQEGWFPIHSAVRCGHWNVVKHFLDQGYSIDLPTKNKEGGSPLHIAAAFGQLEIVENLLALGALHKPDKEDNYPIHDAIIAGCKPIVELFLQKGISPNLVTEDEFGYSLLHLAALHGKDELLPFLFEKGAVNQVNRKGLFPLHVAAANDELGCVTYLLERGGELSEQNEKQFTVLQRAIKKRAYKTIRFLLTKVSELSEQDKRIICNKLFGDAQFLERDLELLPDLLKKIEKPYEFLSLALRKTNLLEKDILSIVFKNRKTKILSEHIDRVGLKDLIAITGTVQNEQILPMNILGYAIYICDIEFLKILLKKGFSWDSPINVKNENMMAALTYALTAFPSETFSSDKFLKMLDFIRENTAHQTDLNLNFSEELQKLKKGFLKQINLRTLHGDMDSTIEKDLINFIKKLFDEDAVKAMMQLLQHLSKISREDGSNVPIEDLQTRIFNEFKNNPHIIEFNIAPHLLWSSLQFEIFTESPLSVFGKLGDRSLLSYYLNRSSTEKFDTQNLIQTIRYLLHFGAGIGYQLSLREELYLESVLLDQNIDEDCFPSLIALNSRGFTKFDSSKLVGTVLDTLSSIEKIKPKPIEIQIQILTNILLVTSSLLICKPSHFSAELMQALAEFKYLASEKLRILKGEAFPSLKTLAATSAWHKPDLKEKLSTVPEELQDFIKSMPNTKPHYLFFANLSQNNVQGQKRKREEDTKSGVKKPKVDDKKSRTLT